MLWTGELHGVKEVGGRLDDMQIGGVLLGFDQLLSQK